MKKVSFRNDILPMKNNLYRLALRITCNNAEAEDVVQDTLIKVWNRRERWDEIESMEAFCMTICRNLALDKIKKMGNQHDSLDDNQQDRPSALNNPYEEMNQKDRIQPVSYTHLKDSARVLPDILKQALYTSLRNWASAVLLPMLQQSLPSSSANMCRRVTRMERNAHT